VLPPDLFQKLFRQVWASVPTHWFSSVGTDRVAQDLLVASLFRNFLLAERLMRAYNCTPVSYPVIPPTFNHHMWQAWVRSIFCGSLCMSFASKHLFALLIVSSKNS
jgi:hypothetical protein